MNCCNCEDKLDKLTELVKKLADVVDELEFDFYSGDGYYFGSEVKISNFSRQRLSEIILNLHNL